MDKKNHNTTGRTERLVEKSLMVVNVRREIIDVLRITNRRFMYDPQTGVLLLGDETYGKSIRSSHAQEFHDSQAGGRFDDYLRGWVGISRRYRSQGILHPARNKAQRDIACHPQRRYLTSRGCYSCGGCPVINPPAGDSFYTSSFPSSLIPWLHLLILIYNLIRPL